MLKLDAKSAKREGLDRYEGFVIDLATLISQLVGFNFTIHISDGYGSKDGNGQWNGMIRDLLEEVRNCSKNKKRNLISHKSRRQSLAPSFLGLGVDAHVRAHTQWHLVIYLPLYPFWKWSWNGWKWADASQLETSPLELMIMMMMMMMFSFL